MAHLGLLYLKNVKKVNHPSFHEIFATDGTGMEIFRVCMSYNRFLFLLLMIWFDDVLTRNQRKQIAKLTEICKFYKNLSGAAKLAIASLNVTIDETLAPFRERCSFIQYISNKPAKYGLKIFVLYDAKSFYTGNLEVYCGKQPDGLYQLLNSSFDIVSRLVNCIKGSGCNITTDNWYTSYPLAISLIKQK